MSSERDAAASTDGHEKPTWMNSPPESDTAQALIDEFWNLANCPQLWKSDGERCCEICLYELGWLALDLIPRLTEMP